MQGCGAAKAGFRNHPEPTCTGTFVSSFAAQTAVDASPLHLTAVTPTAIHPLLNERQSHRIT